MTDNLPSTTSALVPRSPSKPSSNATDLARIGSLVTRLLSHYWTANDSTEARQMQIEDWLTDLREFTPAIVEEACAEWRRIPSSHRPVPGDIRTRCVRLQGERRPASTLTDMEVYARSAGWSSAAERADAIATSGRRKLNGDWNHPERWHPEERAGSTRGFKSLAASLGVTAREYTQDEMRAAREELGLGGVSDAV